jgi:hypothetical protein
LFNFYIFEDFFTNSVLSCPGETINKIRSNHIHTNIVLERLHQSKKLFIILLSTPLKQDCSRAHTDVLHNSGITLSLNGGKQGFLNRQTVYVQKVLYLIESLPVC